jgi:hypothetical protein
MILRASMVTGFGVRPIMEAESRRSSAALCAVGAKILDNRSTRPEARDIGTDEFEDIMTVYWGQCVISDPSAERWSKYFERRKSDALVVEGRNARCGIGTFKAAFLPPSYSFIGQTGN